MALLGHYLPGLILRVACQHIFLEPPCIEDEMGHATYERHFAQGPKRG